MPFSLADFYNETRGARKIIVIDLGYLGDSIHLLPALHEIKRNYPQAELHVASAPVGSELLAMSPAVDRTWPLERSPTGTPWKAQWRWIRTVRQQHFDLAFNFSGTDRTVFLSFLSGARQRVAFAGGRRHFWNSWLIPHWVPRVDRTVPVAEQRRQVLTACGLSLGPLTYELRLPSWATQWAQERVPANAIHFSVNAGNALKEWPLVSWIELGRSLLQNNPDAHLIATGSRNPRERERVLEFARSVDPERVHVYAGNLALAQLSALLARCRLHVGADSGALHLAGILGVKTVSLFRDYAGLGEWLPRGPHHRSIVVPCGCVNQKIQPCGVVLRPECLARISVDEVLALVQQLE
jgi:lipopolysaccharide heptosyltransferase III